MLAAIHRSAPLACSSASPRTKLYFFSGFSAQAVPTITAKPSAILENGEKGSRLSMRHQTSLRPSQPNGIKLLGEGFDIG